MRSPRFSATLVGALLLSACAPLRPAPQQPGSSADARVPIAPAVMTNESREPSTVEVTLTAAPARLSLVPGAETDVYAYNGTVPGPTLEVREGDRVIVHVRNELPEQTTVHWHGLHIPWHTDGSPFHPIPPGGQADFEFTIPAGTAGTYWYHPHPHHMTRDQVAKGLFGAIIVRDPDDPLPPLTEKLLILTDGRFLADGTVDLPALQSPQGRVDFENGWEGDVLFVNGKIAPTIPMRSGEVQRWRVINASAARVYRLTLPGHRLLHVGSDGGLFEHPVDTTEVRLAASERVELLVRATGAPSDTTTLQTLGYDRYIPQTRPPDWQRTRDLARIAYTRESRVRPRPLPATLRPVPPMDTTAVTVRRVMVLTQGFINGKALDLARVDQTASLGATEIWQIENLVGMNHPFHLHGYRFQVIERNGVPVTDRRWEDTVDVPKHETVRIIVKFDDYPGKWMFHCHILDHEVHGMMGVLEVK